MLSLEAESYTWFAFTVVIVAFRLVSRRLLLGSWKKLQTDDALMVLAVATDLVLIIALNFISRTDSNLIHPGDNTTLDDEEVKKRAFGSKMVLVVEQMQCVTIWLVKACLLLMYHRLTMSLSQNRAVKAVAIYVAVGFVVMEILYLGVWCRPFTEYWAVPPKNTQCSAATNHLITNAVLNISSDIMIILIPMPIFLRSTLTAQRKAVLCGVFAVGTFTIICAILNKYYSFTQPFGSDWTFWYMRESSTALMAANLPLTWTLLQRAFNLKSFRDNYSNSRSHNTSRFRSITNNTNNDRSRRHRGVRETLSSVIDRTESEERMHPTPIPLKIYQKREVEVSTVPAGIEVSKDPRLSSNDSLPLPDGMKTVVNVRGGSHASRVFDETTSETEKSVGSVI